MTSKMKRVSLALIAQVLLLPALALAADTAHGAHHAPAITSLIWPTVNFLIYFFAMRHFYMKFARPGLLSRAASYEQHSQKAAVILENAERELRDVEDRLSSIKEEQQSIRERLATEGAQIAAQVMAAGEQSAQAVRRDVARRIDQEFNAANNDVKQQVIARATELARAQLQAGLSEEDDLRLRQDAVRGLI